MKSTTKKKTDRPVDELGYCVKHPYGHLDVIFYVPALSIALVFCSECGKEFTVAYIPVGQV